MYGTLLTSQFNYQLFNFAVGLMNDAKQTIEVAELLAPSVVVPGAHGQYKQFNDANSFRTYTTERAIGGGATRIAFSASDAYFNCKPQALEVGIDVEEENQAGEQGVGLLRESKVRALVNGKLLSHTFDLFTYVAANVTATAGIGNFSNPDIDPIAQISGEVRDLSTDVGTLSNVNALISIDAWLAIINNKQVKERTKYSQAVPLTEDQFGLQMLGIPIKTKIFSIVTDTAGLGQTTATKRRIATGDIYLFYSVPNPSVYDPSAFKTFTTKPAFIDGVRQYPTPDNRQMIYALDWSRQFVKTSALSVRRITVT